MPDQFERERIAAQALLDQEDAAAAAAIKRLGPDGMLALHLLLHRRNAAAFRAAPDSVLNLVLALAGLGWGHALGTLAGSEFNG